VPIDFAAGEDHLPPGRHQASVEEVGERLVEAFPESATRRPIYDQWLELREAIRAIVPLERQWLNGSFVSRKPNPRDLDVASFVDGNAVEALTGPERAALDSLCGGSDTERFPLCDSFLIVNYANGHPLAAVAREIEETFDSIFYGFDDRLNLAKGYLEVAG